MEEKGLGVCIYFKTKGIKGTPKELAKTIVKISNKRERKKRFDAFDESILDMCSELGIEPRTVRSWLKFLSVPQEIRTMELNKSEANFKDDLRFLLILDNDNRLSSRQREDTRNI